MDKVAVELKEIASDLMDMGLGSRITRDAATDVKEALRQFPSLLGFKVSRDNLNNVSAEWLEEVMPDITRVKVTELKKIVAKLKSIVMRNAGDIKMRKKSKETLMSVKAEIEARAGEGGRKRFDETVKKFYRNPFTLEDIKDVAGAGVEKAVKAGFGSVESVTIKGKEVNVEYHLGYNNIEKGWNRGWEDGEFSDSDIDKMMKKVANVRKDMEAIIRKRLTDRCERNANRLDIKPDRGMLDKRLKRLTFEHWEEIGEKTQTGLSIIT